MVNNQNKSIGLGPCKVQSAQHTYKMIVYSIFCCSKIWRVQMQKPLSSIWNFLLKLSFLSSLCI